MYSEIMRTELLYIINQSGFLNNAGHKISRKIPLFYSNWCLLFRKGCWSVLKVDSWEQSTTALPKQSQEQVKICTSLLIWICWKLITRPETYFLSALLNSRVQQQCFGVCFFLCFKSSCLGLISFSHVKIKHLTYVWNLTSLKEER